MSKRHLLVPTGIAAAVAAVPGLAVAAWLVNGSNSGTAGVGTLAQPAGTSATAAGPSAIDIAWTPAAAGSVQAQATYFVTGSGTCSALATASGCQVTGLTTGTPYSFTITPRIGTSWTGPTASASATTAGAAVTVGTPDLQSTSDSGTSQADDLTNDQTATFSVAATTGASVQLFDGATATGTAVVAVGGTATVTTGTLSGSAAGTVHNITAKATLSATTVTSGAIAVTIDTAGPSGSTMTFSPTGSAGVVSSGDVINFVFNEKVAPGSLVSGWNGTGTTPITLSLNNGTSGSNDTITFGSLTIGTLNLGNTNFTTATATATANVSMSNETVTVTLTSSPANATAGGNGSQKATASWTSLVANTDLAGNPGVAATKSSGNDTNF